MVETNNTVAVLSAAEQELYASLIQAIIGNNIEQLTKILEAPNIKDVINIKNADGDTALHLAAEGGHTAAIVALLKVPWINVNANNKYGATPWRRAMEEGHIKAVEALLRGVTGD